MSFVMTFITKVETVIAVRSRVPSAEASRPFPQLVSAQSSVLSLSAVSNDKVN